MRLLKWIPVLAGIAVVAACFYPWVTVQSRQLVITGFETGVAEMGKPGLLHSFLAGLFAIFILIHRVWSVRAAFFLSAINIAWAIRNYLLVAACRGGECPEKHTALYVLLAGSLLMTLSIFFLKPEPSKSRG